MTCAAELVEVRLLQLPVSVWARSQEQHDALRREFALIALSGAERDRHLPRRLAALVESLNGQFAADVSAQQEQLYAAAAAGRPVIDELVYRVPPAVAGACLALSQLLDEADEYCRRGEHLLTLAADEELVDFRHWFLLEFIDQLAGADPVPWPAFARPD